MSKYTPGPWFGMKDGKYDNSQNTWSVDDDAAASSESAPITLEDGTVIAFVVASDNHYFYDDRVSANARLIAKSPEMFELLNELNNWLVCSAIATPEDMAQSFESFQAQIDRLLADARGE